MADVRHLDMMLIDELFEMGGGYVLDFSDRTMAIFFSEELKIDIYDAAYAKNGTSKAKRFRCFLKTVNAHTAVLALKTLWDYREALRENAGKEEKVPRARVRFEELIRRIQGDVAPPTVPTPQKPGLPARAVVDELKAELVALTSLKPQPRGYAFEKFLKRLFDAYDLEARDAFRLRGEQIDGSFVLSGETYLLEAKWQNAQTGNEDLHAFHGKIEQKAAWARGLFISNSGFTADGLGAFGRGKRIVCMDGYDLFEALNQSLSMVTVLERKVRHAAERGECFVSVRDLFA
jgi:predicted protein tyrosine phosphatase